MSEYCFRVLIKIVSQLKYKKFGCINWIGLSDKDGYGRVSYKGKDVRVHRLIMHLLCDFELKDKRLVCHHCDNPKCVNISHLYVGFVGDNNRDAFIRKRHKTGSNHPKSKIKKESLGTIFKMYSSGKRTVQIANKLGVSSTAIRLIIQGKNRKEETKEFRGVK